ncbi:MAG: response regulator [Scytolyngbya sp. HA4215-MV1]|jgi:signal transduction histidine kinase/DNA-binding response OmpR family regulator|nr:response regulator [Scytolyngbya sp. HA4215-MV1]
MINLIVPPDENSDRHATVVSFQPDTPNSANSPTVGHKHDKLGQFLAMGHDRPADLQPRARNMLIKSTNQISILIVDDASDNLRLLAKILETQHYTVRKALNGKMAIQGVHLDPPDLILLDINMPEMDGYEVCQQLKASEATANIPVIFISAFDQVNNKVKAFEMGGQDYITKPFQELEVLARIKNQLLIHQQRQQLEWEIQERQTAEAEVRRLNANLLQQVHVRTLELQQSLKFESTLKRISDRVRDSLDQHQILQNAVEELAIALQVQCCNAVLYSPDKHSSMVRYQYVASKFTTAQEQLLCMADIPEIYTQLQKQRSFFAFCQLQSLAIPNHSAILSCPIFDDQVDEVGILGDLWVFKDTSASFSEMEIHLVQQVANQCAIALRQARLYEAAQAQVKELERLDQLKDDFLNTISHELRTPISSMKMVIQLLNTLTDQGKYFVEELSKSSNRSNRIMRYFEVLQQECDRELALVEDLLSLQNMEAGTYHDQLAPIDLCDFLLHLIKPFETRTQNQQQSLEVNLPADLPALKFDPLVMNRVITELLSNACKYTPAGGKISISAKLSQKKTTPYSTDWLQLSITNTGVEIAPAEHARIFERFYRIPKNDPWKHGGTGLGLALVKKLIEQMNGSIQVESGDNQTCFTLHLKV